jgi:hypothetical protein
MLHANGDGGVLNRYPVSGMIARHWLYQGNDLLHLLNEDDVIPGLNLFLSLFISLFFFSKSELTE